MSQPLSLPHLPVSCQHLLPRAPPQIGGRGPGVQGTHRVDLEGHRGSLTWPGGLPGEGSLRRGRGVHRLGWRVTGLASTVERGSLALKARLEGVLRGPGREQAKHNEIHPVNSGDKIRSFLFPAFQLTWSSSRYVHTTYCTQKSSTLCP